MKKLYFFIFYIISFQSAFSGWEMLPGPGKNTAINCLDYFDGEIFVSIDNNLFSSSDIGKKWTALNNQSEFLFNNIIDVKKTHAGLFIITWDFIMDPTKGIFYSSDNGLNWKSMNSGINMYNSGMIKKLYVQNNDIYVLLSSQIYKFDFNNKKWEIPYDTTSNFPKHKTNSMIIYNDKMFIGSDVWKEGIEQYGQKYANIAIYSLKNRTWEEVLDTVSGIWKETINSFAVQNNKLFAATTGGAFVSSDEGIHWTKMSDGLHVVDTSYSPPWEYDYNVVDIKIGKNYLYALLSGGISTIAYSSNEGEKWIFSENQIFNGFPSSIDLMDDKLLIGTDLGLYISSDNLTSAKKILDTTLCGDVTRDLVSNNCKLYAVIGYGKNVGNNGVWVSTDNGSSWEQKGQNTINRAFTRIAVKDNFIIVGDGYYSKNPYYSIDGGNTFEIILKDSVLTHLQTYCLKIKGDTIYSGTLYGIYYSTNWGKNWNQMSSDISSFPIFTLDFYEDYIFAGSNGNAFYISSDKGITWSKSVIPFTSKYQDYHLNIMDIKVVKKKIYVAAIGYYKDGAYSVEYGGGVFLSKDFGKTWEEKSDGLPGFLGTRALESYKTHLFAGISKDAGIFYYVDLSSMWMPNNSGLTNSYIIKLLIMVNIYSLQLPVEFIESHSAILD